MTGLPSSADMAPSVAAVAAAAPATSGGCQAPVEPRGDLLDDGVQDAVSEGRLHGEDGDRTERAQRLEPCVAVVLTRIVRAAVLAGARAYAASPTSAPNPEWLAATVEALTSSPPRPQEPAQPWHARLLETAALVGWMRIARNSQR